MKQKLLFFLLLIPSFVLAQTLSNSTTISIKKTWSQKPNGWTYPIHIIVPSGPVPQGGFPVCILLHGLTATGNIMLTKFENVLYNHALVAPSGYLASWNICDNPSDAPDMEMINDLINKLQTYTNINPNQIRILGYSNGSSLANRVFIENTNTGVDIICAIAAQLTDAMYHSGDFYYPDGQTDKTSSYCGYDVVTIPIKARKYLSICNENDLSVPYNGGSAFGSDFINAETATFFIAQNQGYPDAQTTGTGTQIGSSDVYAYSYISKVDSCEVVHLKGNAGHGWNIIQEDYIFSFFEVDSLTSAVEENQIENLDIYPNPTNSIITIEGNFATPLNYEVSSILGKRLMTGFLNSNSEQIDLSHLPTNIYFLRVGSQSFKILKTK